MKFSLLVLFILSFIPGFANNDDNIKQLVNQWDELHRTPNTSGFLKLYAPEVLFYGKNSSASECYWLKERFLHSDLKQEVISDINITHYRSGIFKADFTKRLISNKKSSEYFCYLLFKKIDGEYRITGESDIQTDERKHVKLDLGEIDDGSSKLTVTLLIIIGLLPLWVSR